MELIDVLDSMKKFSGITPNSRGKQSICYSMNWRSYCATVECCACILVDPFEKIFKERKMKAKEDVLTIALGVHKMRDVIEQRFCLEGAPCQETYQCFSEGKRDFSKCPLFSKTEAEITRDISREIDIKLLLGEIQM